MPAAVYKLSVFVQCNIDESAVPAPRSRFWLARTPSSRAGHPLSPWPAARGVPLLAQLSPHGRAPRPCTGKAAAATPGQPTPTPAGPRGPGPPPAPPGAALGMLRSPAGWGCEATAWAPEAASRPGVGAAGPGPHGARLGGSGGRAAPWAAGGRGERSGEALAGGGRRRRRAGRRRRGSAAAAAGRGWRRASGSGAAPQTGSHTRAHTHTHTHTHTQTLTRARANTAGLPEAAVAASPAATRLEVTGRRRRFGSRPGMLPPLPARRATRLPAGASRTRARAPGCPAGDPVQVRGARRPAREAGDPAATRLSGNHLLLGFLCLPGRSPSSALEIARLDVYMIILVGNSWHCATHVNVCACASSASSGDSLRMIDRFQLTLTG